MLSVVHIVLAIAFLSGCAKPKPAIERISNAEGLPPEFSAVFHLPDSMTYIDHIWKLPDTDAYYAYLYFTGDERVSDEDIVRMGGSAPEGSYEMRRTKLPVDKVGKFFILSGLDSVTIYSRDNVKLTRGRFSHIEYFEDLIGDSFIAVFDVDDPDIEDASFFIGRGKRDLAPLNSVPFQDDALTSKLVARFGWAANQLWSIHHYRLNNTAVYSCVSVDTTAWIIETTRDRSDVLYKSLSSETIRELVMISQPARDRPLFLASSGLPETDITWSSVLTFNGVSYEATRGPLVNERKRDN